MGFCRRVQGSVNAPTNALTNALQRPGKGQVIEARRGGTLRGDGFPKHPRGALPCANSDYMK